MCVTRNRFHKKTSYESLVHSSIEATQLLREVLSSLHLDCFAVAQTPSACLILFYPLLLAFSVRVSRNINANVIPTVLDNYRISYRSTVECNVFFPNVIHNYHVFVSDKGYFISFISTNLINKHRFMKYAIAILRGIRLNT